MNQYWLDFPTPTSTGTQLNVNVPFPAPNPVPPLITSVGGIQVGDVIWLSNSLGNAVGEVTALNNGSLMFADNDALNLNQSGAAITNNIRALNNGTHLTGYRLFVVTYYLTVPANGESPRLMRQVNGELQFRSPTTSSTCSLPTTCSTPTPMPWIRTRPTH